MMTLNLYPEVNAIYVLLGEGQVCLFGKNKPADEIALLVEGCSDLISFSPFT